MEIFINGKNDDPIYSTLKEEGKTAEELTAELEADASDTAADIFSVEDIASAAGIEVEAEPIEDNVESDVEDEPVEYDEVYYEDVDEADEIQDEEPMVTLAEYEALQARLDRLMQDWENYRRRTSADVEAAKESANRNLIEALIPTLDNFAFAIMHAESSADPSFKEMSKGYIAIYRALLESLSREGMVVINPKPGDAFDLDKHQAVERATDSDYPSGTVDHVVQAGYAFKDAIVRPALVSVVA